MLTNIFVSIIIVHYGEFKYLKDCLFSLYENTLYPNIETIIVDNTNLLKIEEIDINLKKTLNVKIINNKKNLGYASSINIGINHSKGSILAILNNDIIVGYNWLIPLLKVLEDKTIAGVQGKILSWKNKNKFDYAGAAGGYIDIFGYPFCRGRIFDTIEEDKKQYDNVKKVFWISGACMIIKREIYEECGQFDEIFFMYGEEIDWCWRVNSLGYKFLFVPQSVVYHVGSASVQKWPLHKKIFYLHRNHLILLLKNYSFKTLCIIFPFKILMEFISCLYYFTKKNFRSSLSVLNSLKWILFNSRFILHLNKKNNHNKIISDKILIRDMYKFSIAFEYYILKKKYFYKIIRKEKNGKN